jgi:predicted P-loop ATPase
MSDLVILPRHNLISVTANSDFTALKSAQQIFPYDSSSSWKDKLRTQYQTEAAVVQYTFKNGETNTTLPFFCRLKEESILYLMADPRIQVWMNWIVLDWDLPSKGILWGAPEKPITQDEISDFISKHEILSKSCAYYFSKSGVRVVFRLANPLHIKTIDDVFVWKSFFQKFVTSIDLGDIGGTIEVKSDPFTLNRAPNVHLTDGRVVTGKIVFNPAPDATIQVHYPTREQVSAARSKANGGGAKATNFSQLPRDLLEQELYVNPLLKYLRENPTRLSYPDWRAIGVNVITLLGDSQETFKIFDDISKWDPNYSAASVVQHWPSMVRSANEYGPTTWSKFTFDLKLVFQEFDPPSSLAASVRKAVEARLRKKAHALPSNVADVYKKLTKFEKKDKSGNVISSRTAPELRNLYTILMEDNRWKNRIKRNHLGFVDTIDGERISDEIVTSIRVQICRDYSYSAKKDETWEIIKLIASQNEYHPVNDYLRSLSWDGQDRILGLANSLGHSSAYVQLMLRKFIISAVVRPLEWDNEDANMKVDTVLLLKGGQGKRKSTFFKALCREREWFSDSLPSITHDAKDAKMHVLGTWIIEQAEFEGYVARSSVEMMKGFITREKEKFRAPYGRGEMEARRTSIFVGTTNSESFLNDPTGDRRFWVIEIPADKEIDVGWVRANQDQIWAQAVHMYMQGEVWWMVGDEESMNNTNNLKFRRPEPLAEAIEDFVNTKPVCSGLKSDDMYEDNIGFTFAQLARQALDRNLADVKPTEAVSITSILAKLGWVKIRVRNKDNRHNVFRKLRNFVEQEDTQAEDFQK